MRTGYGERPAGLGAPEDSGSRAPRVRILNTRAPTRSTAPTCASREGKSRPQGTGRPRSRAPGRGRVRRGTAAAAPPAGVSSRPGYAARAAARRRLQRGHLRASPALPARTWGGRRGSRGLRTGVSSSWVRVARFPMPRFSCGRDVATKGALSVLRDRQRAARPPEPCARRALRDAATVTDTPAFVPFHLPPAVPRGRAHLLGGTPAPRLMVAPLRV